MKQTMLEMMQQMGPYMGPVFWTGAILLGLGILFILARFILNLKTAKAVSWSTHVVLAVGVFFVVAHFMGTYLGMDTPYIAFGDVTTFDIIKGHFWVLGSGLLAAAVVLKLLLRLKKDTVA